MNKNEGCNDMLVFMHCALRKRIPLLSEMPEDVRKRKDWVNSVQEDGGLKLQFVGIRG